MRFSRGDVGLIELDRCAGERSRSVTSFALQATLRTVTGHDRGRILVGFEMLFNVRFFFRVFNSDRIRCGFGALERVRHRKRDVLAIVTNDIVFEGWPSLDADASKT